jgi:hypothetical protein
LVEAREAYLKVINESLPPSAPEAFVKAQADARTELAEFEAAIPKLKIEVSGAEAGEVHVTIDGEPLPSLALGVATPVNPGSHRVVVTSEGKKSIETSVSVKESSEESLQLELVDAPSAAKAGATSAGSEPAREPSKSKRKYWGYGIGAVGIAAVGTGAVFGILTLTAAKKAQDDPSLCPEKKCTPDGDAFVKSSQVKGNVANIALGAGAVLLGVGTYLILSSPKDSQEVVRVEPVVGPTGGSLSFSGAF